jgi:hypothetical protein
MSVGSRLVELVSLHMERAELLRILGERPPARSDTLPGFIRVRIEEEREAGLRERCTGRLRSERSAAELDHRAGSSPEHVEGGALLELAESGFATFVEELGNGRPGAFLDYRVDGDERATKTFREYWTEGRLPRAHEPDQPDVTVQRVEDGQEILSR